MVRQLMTAALAAMLVFQLSGCGRKKAAKVKEKVVKVSVSPLIHRNFQYKIPVQGTVKPVDYATISAKIGGTVDDMKVLEGSRVKKGELLFVIDRQTLKNRVTVSEKELAVAKTELKTAQIENDLVLVRMKKAESDFKRASTLYASHAVSQDHMETFEVAIKAAESEVKKAAANVEYRKSKVEQQESNLDIARKNLEDSLVRAPYDCVVTSRMIEPGEFVQMGTPIIEIEDHSRLQVECYLSSIYYNYIKPGKTKVFFSLDGNKAGEAVVTYRAPSIDPVSRTFKIKVRLPENTVLVSGLLCDMTVILEERLGQGIPDDAALLRDQGRYIAFIAGKDKRAVEVTVKKGIIDGTFCELINADQFKNAKFIVSGQTFVNRGDLLDILPAETGKKK